jgi:ferredoxin-thioredoxin reductase catalytic subunit
MSLKLILSEKEILDKVEKWRKRHQFDRDFNIKIDRSVPENLVEGLVSKLEKKYNIKVSKRMIAASKDHREYFIYLYFKRKTITTLNLSWSMYYYYDEVRDNYLIVERIIETDFKYLI